MNRFDRMRAFIMGGVGGAIVMVFDHLFGISEKIIAIGLAPWYSEGILSLIILPMVVGAGIVVVYRLAKKPVTVSRRGLVEGSVVGAVGSVGWWVVPLALYGLSWYWVFLTSMYIGWVISLIADLLVVKTPSNMFSISQYIGGAVGGAVFGWGLGAFAIVLVKEAVTQASWVQKVHKNWGAVLGALAGVVISVFYVYDMIDAWMKFD